MGDGKPTYDFGAFVKACSQGINVVVRASAREDAEKFFNLKTSVEIIAFIGQDGLGKCDFHSAKKWEQNPTPEIEIMADSYRFYFGSANRCAYVAICFQPVTRKWIIKSFHLDAGEFQNHPLAGLKGLLEKKSGDRK